MYSIKILKRGIDLRLFWDRPVVVFYKEKLEEPERSAFMVVKARTLVILNSRLDGKIVDFFPLIGNIDYISTDEGISNRYILCWFDDNDDNYDMSWRRLTGVSFHTGIISKKDTKGKKTYNINFTARSGKIR
jgi:hypothetical protein